MIPPDFCETVDTVIQKYAFIMGTSYKVEIIFPLSFIINTLSHLVTHTMPFS